MSDTATFLIVKGTLVLLVVLSALTWALVIVKSLQHVRLARNNRSVIGALARTKALPAPEALGKLAGPAARVALAGVETWGESGETIGVEPAGLPVRQDLLERSLRQQVQRERRNVESGLPVLASIGATAPFIGLFGTVLGIIHALQRISGTGSASLEVVAGPIGEALVATGIGIAVAVPAVVAYNVFVRRTKGLLAELDDFGNTLVQRAVTSVFRVERSIDRSVNHGVALRRETTAEPSV